MEKHTRKSTRTYVWFIIAFAVWIFWTATHMRCAWVAWELLLSLILFVVSLHLATIVHELGHVWAARIVGWRTFRIVLGVGRLLRERQILGTHVEIRSLRFRGMALVAPRDYRGFRLKALIVFSGGVIANLLAGAFGLLLDHNLAEDWFRPENASIPPACFWFLGQALMLWSLVPYRYNSVYGRLSSDGMSILTVLFKPTRIYCEMERAAYVHEFIELRKQGKAQAALDVMEKAAVRFPGEPVVHINVACAYSDLERYAEGEAAARRAIESKTPEAALRPMLLNNLAWCILMQEVPERLSEARAYAEQAYASLPWNPGVQSTLGSAKVMQGETAEGKALLEQAISGVEDTRSRELIQKFIDRANRKLAELATRAAS